MEKINKISNEVKLLILTQKIDQNDDLLGFFHGWTARLAGHFERVTVIALGVGQYDLPDNVRILSLGKETVRNFQFFKRIKYAVKFYRLIWQERKEYDTVFIHMNQEYAILGGWLWHLWGKKVALWRNHPKGDFWADLSAWFSDKVFCTSRFAYVTKFKKTRLMPVGVDTEFFKPEPGAEKIPDSLLFFGRLSPIKKPDIFIEALRILKERKINFAAKVIGDAPSRDEKYSDSLKQLVEKYALRGNVKFQKGAPHSQAPAIFNRYGIFVNATPSGSMDKTIFEAMACGVLAVASNKNLETLLPEELAGLLIFKEGDASDLAGKIAALMNLPPEKTAAISQELRQIIEQEHSLKKLTEKLIEELAL